MAHPLGAQNGLSSKDTTEIPDSEASARFAQLDHLRAQGTLKYNVKDYDAAAEFFSQATELQAEIYGEMASQNADLLYDYGRCLYHVAVANNDVLGSKVASDKRQDGSSRSRGKKAVKEDGTQTDSVLNDQRRVEEEIVTKVVEEKEGPAESIINPADKDGNPFFQFTGDENFDNSEEEGEGADRVQQDGEAEEDDDDFVNAYEVLDLTRVLLLKRLEEEQPGKGKETEPSAVVRQLKERLADTHDLQAEISLEGERFPNAVVDSRAALDLKEELFPPESSLIAEAHYKLSLALEFSSVTQQKNENGDIIDGGEAMVDDGMREEAAREMEAAIASCKRRIQKEETPHVSHLDELQGSEKSGATQTNINDVKEMISEMEQRLIDLRQAPVSINDPTGTGSVDGANPLSGILGSILGEPEVAQRARIEEASKGANDLTGLVKRKKASNGPLPQSATIETLKTKGKRKSEFVDEVIEVGSGKKVRLSDGEEE